MIGFAHDSKRCNIRGVKVGLNKIEQWLKQKSLETTPKSALGEAISYTLKRWDKLCAYVTNGMYHIDNNPVERSIRPIALGLRTGCL